MASNDRFETDSRFIQYTAALPFNIGIRLAQFTHRSRTKGLGFQEGAMMLFENKRRHRTRAFGRAVPGIVVCSLFCALLFWVSPFCGLQAAAQSQSALRDLSGKVTDGHEPLRGAIVQLENPATNTIVTYITEADGLYHFKRLDGETDFNVWVMFRGRRSSTHSISKFDSHMNKVINFSVKAY